MQQQHQYPTFHGEWGAQHPHAHSAMNPAMHVWANGVTAGPRMSSPRFYSGLSDPQRNRPSKNAVLHSQPHHLYGHPQQHDSFITDKVSGMMKLNGHVDGHNGVNDASIAGSVAPTDLSSFLLAQLANTAHEQRMPTLLPAAPQYSMPGWSPEHPMSPFQVGGSILPRDAHQSSTAYSDMMQVPYQSRDYQPLIPGYLSPENNGTFSGSGISGNSAHPPVTDLRTLQAVLREAKPGSGKVAEALLQVAFPLRLPGLTAIMGRFTKSGQWAISLEIFDTLPALALPRDTTVCNAALAACMRGCLWQRAKQTFDLMLSQGVPLDNITYYTMLSVPRRRKLWRVTMDLFIHMCQADVQPVLPDVAGMLSEIAQDGKWPLSEKLFNYVFRHVLPLVEPQHIDSSDMKDLNASDLQIVRMLNNALRQSGVHAPAAPKSVNIHNGPADGPGHFRGYSEGGSMSRTSLFAQSGSNSSGSIGNGGASGSVPIPPNSLRPPHGQENTGVDEVTSSLSNFSFDRPRSSDTTGTSRTDSRGDASDMNGRGPAIDSALEAILQQAAAAAARETQPGPPPPESSCCNELLSVYLRCGQQQRAMELLRRMLACVPTLSNSRTGGFSVMIGSGNPA